MEFLNDPHIAWKFKNTIISQVKITELMSEYGIKLESKIAGQFTHRARCPFHKGKNGGPERTPSLFVSEQTNSFCCFGCGQGGSVIEFVSLIEGSPPLTALIKLAKRIGLMDKDGKWDELKLDALPIPVENTKTIEPFLFEISATLREYIKSYVNATEFEKELVWMEKVSSKVDEFLSNIGYEDYDYAQDLCDKIKTSVRNRKRKKDK